TSRACRSTGCPRFSARCCRSTRSAGCAGRTTPGWSTAGSSKTARRIPTGRLARKRTRLEMLSRLAAPSGLAVSVPQTSTLGTSTDVSRLLVSTPTVVGELDPGQLKGELRQIGWSSDGSELYIETAEGKPPSEKLHDYTLPIGGGTPAPQTQKPEWASSYWAFKSDRFAPGLGSVFIDVDQ